MLHCVLYDGEDLILGFILPVVFKLAPNLNLVKDDSQPVAFFQPT